ncbi:MAG: AraC family transcriptional regulator, partial [Deltaproteobacteria bacterium]|nr:AraC family transcriptional regulator [Deltaproteobacteria bacterium]
MSPPLDVLAGVFATTRVGGAIFGAVELSGEWGMTFDRQDKAGFHLVRRGRCWLRLSGSHRPVELAEGDVVVLPRGWRHVLPSGARTPPRPYRETLAQQAGRGGNGPAASLVCGAFAFDTPEPHPLLSALPQVVHAHSRGAGAPASLTAVMGVLEQELSRPAAGSDVVVRRLLDVVLLYAIRGWVEAGSGEEATGWMGALRDGPTARALGALHAEPGRRWTLEGLARRSGVSRATLARSFRARVGEAPLAYLRRWRMTLAAQALRQRDVAVAELALQAGYESEAAFHRAFTRARGVTPAEYRKAARQPTGTPGQARRLRAGRATGRAASSRA